MRKTNGSQLIGYVDSWSVAPGESLKAMISTDADQYKADLVKLRHGDPRPHGPGFKEHAIEGVLSVHLPGREQVAQAGSFVRISPHARLSNLTSLTVQLWVWATTPGRASQGLVSALSQNRDSGWGLLLDDQGHVVWTLIGIEGRHRLTSPAPLREREWYFVYASYDAATGTTRLGQWPSRRLPDDETMTQVAAKCKLGALTGSPAGLLLAAANPQEDSIQRFVADGHFDGKLDSPRLFSRQLTPHQIDRLRDDDDPMLVAGDWLLAAWNFGHQTNGEVVADSGQNGMHGVAINLPTRAMTGHNWTGRSTDHRMEPDQYGAIHFHSDDLEDAAWSPDFEFTVPKSLRSGVYAIRLRAGETVDRIPFFVRPPRGRATARLAVLLPTLTYLAYGNERVQFTVDYAEAGIIGHEIKPDPRDLWLRAHPELGLSTYDRHVDGSGSCYASRLRPIPNMRPDYVNWLTGASRHLAADLYLIDWLEEHRIRYDIITDEDLHEEGAPLLCRYKVVATGSHPEYYTERMVDAMECYVWHAGGRLMYLGGNGFYWVTSICKEKPHIMEVRRGYSATRGWESQPGETHHATTGEPGGLWRHRGRAPNKMVGVGFSAQGWDQEAPGYTRTSSSYKREHQWIFGNAAGPTIGDFGLVMGGAAGDEIDRYDPALGSPPHAVVLATSQGRHSRHYLRTVEDVPVLLPGLDGPHDESVRADLTYFPTRRGGAVFSAGSVSWTGSLSHNAYNNEVSHVTMNVLHRFMTSQPGIPQVSQADDSDGSAMSKQER